MLMVSKPNKLILESLAKVKGVSVEKVQEDLKNKKKTRKKKKNSGATLEIVSDRNAKTIDYSQVRGNIKRTKPKENVFDWSMKDIALYIRSKYEKKYNEDWKHRISGVSTELMRLHDRILDIYGHCDTLVLRDYIDYIFEEFLDRILDKANGIFYLRNFRDDVYISAFSEVYDYKDSFEKEKWGDIDNNKLNENLATTNSSINEVFLLSEESFVTTYGIIIAIFWLIKCRNYSNKDAASKVLEICKKVHEKGEFKFVKDSTESLSPYHESIRFPKMNEFLANIDGRYKIEVQYKENDIIKSKFKFLLEEKE